MAEALSKPALQDHQTAQARESKAGLTPDQVRAIADHVYAMLLRELHQERERKRISCGSPGSYKGGA